MFYTLESLLRILLYYVFLRNRFCSDLRGFFLLVGPFSGGSRLGRVLTSVLHPSIHIRLVLESGRLPPPHLRQQTQRSTLPASVCWFAHFPAVAGWDVSQLNKRAPSIYTGSLCLREWGAAAPPHTPASKPNVVRCRCPQAYASGVCLRRFPY